MSVLDGFLRAAGYGAAGRAPLAGDAGHRRYWRLLGGPRPAVLMDGSAAGPPSAEADLRAFLAVGAHLRGLGLSAPEVLAAEPPAGLLLLEDLGDDTHAALLDAGEDPWPLYRDAADGLARLHEAPPPPGLPAWDAGTMAARAGETLLDWWWPAALGRPPSPAQRAGLRSALVETLSPHAARGFVHRDWFPANLMRLDRPGPARLGVLDFQDAALGHPAYDLVSLVEDARRDVAPAIREAAVSRYLARRPGLDPEAFRAAMAAVAAQRHLRVAALWTRLARRDGKPGYLVHGPRCWRLLEAALAHPACAPLARFLDAELPRALRADPPLESAA